MRTVAGGPYPSPSCPDIREAVGLRLNAVGQVEWFANAPTDASGIIPDMPRAEVSSAVGPAFPGSPMEEPASDFAVRFDHKGCHYEYLDTFTGTYSHGGGGPRPFPLSKDQRLTLFKAIVAARIFDLPPIVSAEDGEPSSNYELEVQHGGKRRIVAWNANAADRSLPR